MRRGTAVYIIETDRGVCKVGISNNPTERLVNLQTGSPFRLRLVYAAIHSDASRIETIVHHMLRDKLAYGEWFCVSQDVARDAIWKAAAQIGKPIAGSGYDIPRRSRRYWFFFALWLVILAAFFLFIFSLRS
jgi:hypothetical protein